ncbi:MAG TPA: phosphatidate cytidylyltransferase [Chlorobaculum parvum]|uniref:Phosphatidate cytidylyltransferase n=1 Tax=Chlorobaculum parvum TaxID=274539 RepID=A0A7C5HG19_9CHLB|nr:phosphatidate cytidylyltransferase [Chlorobaculum parvum]
MSSLTQSNLFQRVAVAIVGIPLLLWLNIQGGIFFFSLVLALSLMAIAEFRRLAVHHAHPVSLLVLLLLTALLQLNFYFRIVDYWEAVLVAVMALQVIELWRTQGSQLMNIGSTLLGLLYVNLCFGSLLRLRLAETTTGMGTGESLVLLLFMCVWAADIFAYFGGRGLGGKIFGRKFFARISPKKTWEGYLVGIAGSVLAAWGCSVFISGCPDGRALPIGLFIGAVGPLGDLMESMFKRDAGVKDSSALIPGHGGVLDRFDTIMFMAPLLYLFVTYL